MNGSVMFAAGEDNLNRIRITEINVNSYLEYALFYVLLHYEIKGRRIVIRSYTPMTKL